MVIFVNSCRIIIVNAPPLLYVIPDGYLAAVLYKEQAGRAMPYKLFLDCSEHHTLYEIFLYERIEYKNRNTGNYNHGIFQQISHAFHL